jgi:hypothetical protein
MAKIIKVYPEFNNYSVEYSVEDDQIDWVVTSADGDYLMHGVFKSKDFYKSVFDLPISGMAENMYEELFYLYFENIKLACINIVEDKDADELLDEEDVNSL